MSIAEKFNIPPALFETIRKMNAEETEYQMKVKALMKKKGITSLGQLSPEEKKDFFNTLDSMHKAKNEEVKLDESINNVHKGFYDKVSKSKLKKVSKIGSDTYFVKSRSIYDPHESHFKTASGKYGSTMHSSEGGVPSHQEIYKDIKDHNPHLSKDEVKSAADVVHAHMSKHRLGEEVELDEAKSSTGYDLYHKDFSSAMQHAYDFAKKKYGIEIDPTEIDRNVAMGPRKPGSGKANAYRLLDKTGKKAIQVQVANLDNKRYELNMYKEEVEQVDELKVSTLTRYGTKATQAYGRNPEKDDKRQQGIQRARAKVQQKTMKKEEIELTESHFKVGQRVKCIASGMKGTVVKVDKPEVGKYYTVRQDSGKMMKYAPDELKALSTNEAKDGGASKKKENEFHKKLDKLVHKTFGHSSDEKKVMKEEIEELDEGLSAAQISKLRDAYASIDKIDVSGQPYKQLVAFLDKQDLKTLKMLAGAKIKFISGMAQNRVVRKMNESIGSTIGGALGQYAGAKMGLEGPGRAHGENLGRALEYYARLILHKLTKEEVEQFENESEELTEDLMKLDPITNTLVAAAVGIGITMSTLKYWFGPREDLRKPIEKGLDKAKKDGNAKLYHSLAAKYWEDIANDYQKKLDSLRKNPESVYKRDNPKTGAKAGDLKKFERLMQDEFIKDIKRYKEKAKEFSAKERSGEPISKKYYESYQHVAEEETKEFMVKFEKQGKVSVKNYTGKSELDVRSKAKVDAKRMGMTVASVRLKEEVEEAVDPQKSMKRAGLSVARAKEVMRHRKEIGAIRKKREALRSSFDPTATVLEAYKKSKMKKEATAKDNKKDFKSGDKLSGKTEPIEINPELKEQKT